MLQALIRQINDDNREGLEKALTEAVDYLHTHANKISTIEDLEKVALMAYNNAPIAKVIAEVVFKLGADALIALEDSTTLETTYEIIEGLKFDEGVISMYMINDPRKVETVLNNPAIFITDRKLLTVNEIIPLLEKLLRSDNKELLIVAEDFAPDVLAVLIMNRQKNGLNIVAIKAPSFGERKRELLKDIAAFTGGQFITSETGLKTETITGEQLGGALKVIVNKDSTTIIGGHGTKEAVEERIVQLKTELESVARLDQGYYKDRIAALGKGVGIIRIGAATDSETKAIKFKVEDAVNSTRLAFKSGVVAGGGQTLKQISTSSEILNTALKEPEKVLIENKTKFTETIDPVEVLVAALQSAVSITLLLNSSKGVIIQNV